MNSKVLKMAIGGFAIAILAVTIMFASGASRAQADNQDQNTTTEAVSQVVSTDKNECASVCTEMTSCEDMTKEDCVKMCEMQCDKKK